MKFIVAQILCFLMFSSVAYADDNVRCVQEHLLMHGYDPGPIDGVNGPGTAQMAANFGIDNGFGLGRLSGGNAADWCAALQLVAMGAGGPDLGEVDTAEGDLQCRLAPDDGYGREITGMVDGDPLTLRVSARFGGAVESIYWRGKEFLNIYDHGRQISYAWHLDGWGECLNPTEPGAAADNFLQSSTTVLEQVCSRGLNAVTTYARPAYWLGPGETGFCDRGAREAKNTSFVSENRFEKTVTIGYRGLGNVIAFDATITLERDYQSLFTEMPTGYLTHEFTARYRFDPATGELSAPVSRPVIEPWSYVHTSLLPPIMATPDGAYAMGAYTAESIETYEMLFYDVANSWDRTNKWNIIKHEVPAPAGEYRYQSFVIVGSLAQVQAAMMALYEMHRADTSPPEGYVDVANCAEIAGWAWDPKAPNVPMNIEIYDITDSQNRTLIFQNEASELRPDLRPVLKDDGRHGFHFLTDQVLQENRAYDLEIEVRNSDSNFPGSLLKPNRLHLSCAR